MTPSLLRPNAILNLEMTNKIEDHSGAVARIAHLGLKSASPLDLLAITLATSATQTDTTAPIGKKWLEKHAIHNAGDLSPLDLRELAGIEGYEATRILCALELGRRAGAAGKGLKQQVSSAADIYEMFLHLEDEKQEHFCAVFLNTKNGVLGTKTIHIGTVNMSVVGPREVFREAVRQGASSLIVVHNHPSGDPSPSPEDITVTNRLFQVGELLDIPLLEHVIIGHGVYRSLKRDGIL